VGAEQLIADNRLRILHKSGEMFKAKRGTPALEALARKGQFSTLTNLARKLAGPELQQWLRADCVGSETPLHVILRFSPSEEVVDAMISLLEDIGSSHHDGTIEESVDDQGRNPLHIAVAHGCHASVVERLLNGPSYSMPAMQRDEKGRYPIHWLCCNPHGAKQLSVDTKRKRALFFKSKKTQPPQVNQSKENAHRVVKRLLCIFPEVAGIPDADGCTPWDLAVKSNAHLDFLEQIQGCITKTNIMSQRTEDTSIMDDFAPLEITETEEDEVSSLGMDGLDPKSDLCQRYAALDQTDL